ncbi:MAG: hypothetical protein MUO77_15980 [Anaerolineales bacterium]|nr:hypothetical protein [Anaerolineales bacterium]
MPTAPQVRESEEWVLWSTSAHANTYDLAKGPNTYCAKCHSPFNWDPQAKIGDSPNCVSCKMSTEKLPRVSEQNPMVSAAEWQNITCDTCHETTGVDVSSSIAWWDQETGQYDQIANSTDLCNQCHRDTEVLRHQIDLKDSAHAGFECVDCHDAHSTAASCSNAGCHENIRPKSVLPPATPMGGQHPNTGSAFCGGPSCHPVATQAALSNHTIHGSVHGIVSCTACHDAGGMQVGPSEELGAWVTFRTMEIDGVINTTPYDSHHIQVEVDCTRCHFESSSWGLPMVTGNEFEK